MTTPTDKVSDPNISALLFQIKGLVEELSACQCQLTDLRAQVERLDVELHQQIQYKLEACRMAEEFKSQLHQRDTALNSAREALEWSRGMIRSMTEDCPQIDHALSQIQACGVKK